MEVHLMNEHDDQQLPDTREVILPEEASAEPTPEQAAGKAAALLLAQAIYDRTAQNLVAPLKWIRQLKLDGLGMRNCLSCSALSIRDRPVRS